MTATASRLERRGDRGAAPSPFAFDPRRIPPRVEFHRHALALLPAADDRHPGVAVMVLDGRPREQRHCSCPASRKRTCAHLKALAEVARDVGLDRDPGVLDTVFSRSRWFRLAAFVADQRRDPLDTVTVQTVAGEPRGLAFYGGDHRLLATCHSGPEDRSRLLERCGPLPEDPERSSRRQVLQTLRRLTHTDAERSMAERGHQTRRMAFEQTFWYALAYHGFRQWEAEACHWRPVIEEQSGRFELHVISGEEDHPLVRIAIPRRRVKAFLHGFGPELDNENGLSVQPIALDWVFDVRLRHDAAFEVVPRLRQAQQDGEYRVLQEVDLERFQYGDLVYLPQLKLLADMRDGAAGPPPSRATGPRLLTRAQVPTFLDEHRDTVAQGRLVVDARIDGFRIIERYDRLSIRADRLEGDWCWLSVIYGAGNLEISLADILRARAAEQRFIETPEGWIDCHDPRWDGLVASAGAGEGAPDEAGRVRLATSALLRLQAVSEVPVTVQGVDDRGRWLRKLLTGEPPRPLPALRGMTSPLRGYQQRGVEWLWFLHQNRFGGLLCDEMGLGKTHQVMALMVGLMAAGDAPGPFLVVCPTTVLSHWRWKLAEHAPDLTVAVYHGGDRDLEAAVAGAQVVLTSYGILRRDAAALSRPSFGLAVFDEIQHLKNVQTQGYEAAAAIRAAVKIGLTGTPMENRLEELKNLMDLVTPGYLGTTEAFRRRYQEPIEAGDHPERRRELSRLIAPFTLRRLKTTVLAELPEKIENRLTCRLSDDQVKLYRDALAGRRGELLAALADGGSRVPYIHIFALLNLLKQICDHPALVDASDRAAEDYRSGKWDLWTELLDDCLSGGAKVVVYSQYLKMIDLIAAHLAERGVEAAVLTGRSRDRGAIIRRFQQDARCRVFVGSLQAAGAGIDLTAASVVVHYDRWWNAAKEDQATDRVHRIGQRRGVQVFKLVTEGTLEEKIDAMIRKKRRLMNTVVPEDDPGTLKVYSREDLMELLALPE